MKRSKQEAPAGLVLESKEPQDLKRKVVYLLCNESDLQRLKQIYDNHLRLIRLDHEVVGMWIYLDELKPIIKTLDEGSGPLLTIKFLQAPYICRFTLGTVQGNTYGIIKKAFFWQSWIGAPFHLEPEKYVNKPVAITFLWNHEFVQNSFGTDENVVATQGDERFTFASQKFMIIALRNAMLDKNLNQIKLLKQDGLLYDLDKFAKFGINFITKQASDGTFIDTFIFMNKNTLPTVLSGSFRRKSFKWITYKRRWITESASTYCNIDMFIVDKKVANYAKKKVNLSLVEWKEGDYQGINKAAFEKTYHKNVFALDKYIYQASIPPPQFEKEYNVYRAYWPGSESDDRQQRGPDMEKLVQGQVINVDGFFATAYRLPPKNFLGSSCCLMIIKVDPKIPCVVLDNDAGHLGGESGGSEHEILFPMGVQLEFVEHKIMEAHNRTVDVAFFVMRHTLHMQALTKYYERKFQWQPELSFSHRTDIVFVHTKNFKFFPNFNPFTVFGGTVMKRITSKKPHPYTLEYFESVKHMFVNDIFWVLNTHDAWFQIFVPLIDPLYKIDEIAEKDEKRFGFLIGDLISKNDERIMRRFDLVYKYSLAFFVPVPVLKPYNIEETKTKIIQLCDMNDFKALENIDPLYFNCLNADDFKKNKKALYNMGMFSANCIALLVERKVSIKTLQPLFQNLTKVSVHPDVVDILLKMSNNWEAFSLGISDVLDNSELWPECKAMVIEAYLKKGGYEYNLWNYAISYVDLVLTAFIRIAKRDANLLKYSDKYDWYGELALSIEQFYNFDEKLKQKLKQKLEEFEFLLRHAK